MAARGGGRGDTRGAQRTPRYNLAIGQIPDLSVPQNIKGVRLTKMDGIVQVEYTTDRTTWFGQHQLPAKLGQALRERCHAKWASQPEGFRTANPFPVACTTEACTSEVRARELITPALMALLFPKQ